MNTLYIALYAPSSVQKLLDFLKTVYAGNSIIPVIIKPFGAAAQVGIPEACKISYKLGKPLIVLPGVSDLKEVLGCDCLYYVSEEGEEVDIHSITSSKCSKTVIMLSSGDQEPSRKELENARIVWIKGVPHGMPSTAIVGVIVYELLKIQKEVE